MSACRQQRLHAPDPAPPQRRSRLLCTSRVDIQACRSLWHTLSRVAGSCPAATPRHSVPRPPPLITNPYPPPPTPTQPALPALPVLPALPTLPPLPRVDAKMFSMREKKVIVDAGGRPVAGLKKKLVSLKPALQLYRGGDFAQPVATIKWVLLTAHTIACCVCLGKVPVVDAAPPSRRACRAMGAGPAGAGRGSRCQPVGRAAAAV